MIQRDCCFRFSHLSCNIYMKNDGNSTAHCHAFSVCFIPHHIFYSHHPLERKREMTFVRYRALKKLLISRESGTLFCNDIRNALVGKGTNDIRGIDIRGIFLSSRGRVSVKEMSRPRSMPTRESTKLYQTPFGLIVPAAFFCLGCWQVRRHIHQNNKAFLTDFDGSMRGNL